MKGHISKIPAVVSLLLALSLLGGCGASPTTTSSRQPQLQSNSASATNQSSQSPTFSQPASVGSSAQDTGTNTYGNTPGNIENYGYATQQGDWIYFQNTGSGNALYKIKEDGTGETMVCADYAVYINVVGNWVYFMDESKNYAFYKVKTDGSDLTLVSTDVPVYLTVVGNLAYYCNANLSRGSNSGPIYKIKTDGTGRTQLTNDTAENINVADGWIYFTNYSVNRWIYKVKTDGSDLTPINSDATNEVIVGDDWIYYLAAGYDNATLYKIKTDGSSKTQLSTSAANFNFDGPWLYCGSMDGGFFKISTDASQEKQLALKEITELNMVGDWYYFHLEGDNKELYRARTDLNGAALVN